MAQHTHSVSFRAREHTAPCSAHERSQPISAIIFFTHIKKTGLSDTMAEAPYIRSPSCVNGKIHALHMCCPEDTCTCPTAHQYRCVFCISFLSKHTYTTENWIQIARVSDIFSSATLSSWPRGQKVKPRTVSLCPVWEGINQSHCNTCPFKTWRVHTEASQHPSTIYNTPVNKWL